MPVPQDPARRRQRIRDLRRRSPARPRSARAGERPARLRHRRARAGERLPDARAAAARIRDHLPACLGELAAGVVHRAPCQQLVDGVAHVCLHVHCELGQCGKSGGAVNGPALMHMHRRVYTWGVVAARRLQSPAAVTPEGVTSNV